MDKNNLIGISLIFILFFIWVQINAPSSEELAAQERIQDSLRMVQQRADSLAQLPPPSAVEKMPAAIAENDSLKALRLYADFGPFAASAEGEEQLSELENEVIKVVFTNKGGRIKEVILKKYFKILTDAEGVETKGVLKLLEDDKNRFEYLLPVEGVRGAVPSSELYFTAQKSADAIVFRANAGDGSYFEQRYAIKPDAYGLDYEIKTVGLDRVLKQGEREITLNWENYLDKLEKNSSYERNYTSVYFKPLEDDPDYCSCTSDEIEKAGDAKLKWVAHSNQFFNSALIADQHFNSGEMETRVIAEDQEDLKYLRSTVKIPIDNPSNGTIAMDFYVGPNKFERLKTYGSDFEDLIPYGWSIFGTVNRWIIRPIFNFLSSFIGSAGLIILLLTLIVKLVLYPLTYKMLYSQSKMGALKPRIAALKEKHGDDQQQQQMETMKLYREFGVSPLGGCLPIALQMPIWFALYRFFPASIEFRQASFLWATDLSSYDVFALLPFEIPFYGSHVSLFTILWALTTVIYTYYNMRHMEMSVNPAMKYMQYFMPLMFLFFFNNFAAGLTCYLFFSNLMNIGQTLVTKNYLIDQEKIKEELEAYRKKPKKKGGFGERLEKALKEQKRIQEEQQEAKKKKKKKK
ncbi:MAG: membrane protein insertase YidC [Bacteroidota bacterium]